LKIWMIGARGTVATTAAAGTLAAQRELLPFEGLLTETAAFADLDLAGLGEIRFGGCDIHEGTLADSARSCLAGVDAFSEPLLDRIMPELEKVRITRGILRGGGRVVEELAGRDGPGQERRTARSKVDQLIHDLNSFADGSPAVVVNLASTEPLVDPNLMGWDLASFERALDADDARIPASSLYTYAALRAGLPYVNFTPSAGGSLPALIELAREVGVPIAGRDGKTGETLLKTALAPMFAIRALAVEGWYGTNILGNTDGRVLADPANRASKIASKSGVLEACLGYTPEGDVRIDYFPPLADHKVAWNFIQFRGWAGHRMRMQFTWEGTDSILAAPLVIDLARLIELAQRRGEAGPIGALGLFFKTPEGTPEMNLHRQYEALLRWAGQGAESASSDSAADLPARSARRRRAS
jgi:myo-inositol-1-phosphate synthase